MLTNLARPAGRIKCVEDVGAISKFITTFTVKL